ncbi:hypothetical protein [Tropicibacter naphthalenivorans]|uniref:Uncharacterized protein n=1 Tax=Tropicibacter naphthalenivorans TaxID=441103 RepID=A0A0N7M0U1_9RHOB|nr:hypothetical protein [Tropicibacter naphthalenivorans]CUH81409.1 hypothetical protein TRN7648_03453 [Tropicibacter naphthalenivorans]SMD00551.1 hypothetical protein SAMN04488093_109137 [Tropicibacter naphthalenivorans]
MKLPEKNLSHMSERPTYENIAAEQTTSRFVFIGPPAPLQLPKVMPSGERAALSESYRARQAEDLAFDTQRAAQLFQHGPGWGPLVRDLLADLQEMAEEIDEPFLVQQIKSQSGDLRVDVHSGNPEVLARIERARNEAIHTCENCGSSSEGVGSTRLPASHMCHPCTEARLRKLPGGRVKSKRQ